MFEVRRSPSARTAEEAMPESLSVAFGAYLDELAEDPWSAGEPWSLNGDARQKTRVGTFGLGGRGMVTFVIRDDAEHPFVLITQLNF